MINKAVVTKKEKSALISGIVIVLIVVFISIFGFALPLLIARIQSCSPGFVGYIDSTIILCQGYPGIAYTGFVCLILIGVPLSPIGFGLILYYYLSRKRYKNPGLIAFLIILMSMFALGIVFAVVFLASPSVWH